MSGNAVQALVGKRRIMFAVNLAYFAVLLAVGTLIFLKGTPYALLLALACVATYLLAVRPYTSKYKQEVRSAMLCAMLDRLLTGHSYEPKSGVERTVLEKSGLTPVPLLALHSRELVRGKAGEIRVTAADVAFPIRENGLNAMFNGCFLSLEVPDASLDQVTVVAGESEDLDHMTARQRELIQQMGELIPGSLYLHMEGERLDVLLRGRFLGFRVNPLAPVTETLLSADPLPELGWAIQLASCSNGQKGD